MGHRRSGASITACPRLTRPHPAPHGQWRVASNRQSDALHVILVEQWSATIPLQRIWLRSRAPHSRRDGVQERFRSLGPIYYRGADAAVLVYDVTSEASFARVRSWIKELKQMVGACHHSRCRGLYL